MKLEVEYLFQRMKFSDFVENEYLSVHVKGSKEEVKNMVPPAGIEPAAPGLGNSSGSNQSDPSENPD